MKLRYLALVAGLLVTTAASAQDKGPDYLDNRSTAETLIQSLYNAIKRQEFSRAWSYYGEEKPAANIQEYAAGFATTKSVEIAFGETTSDGAAGSIYYTVPLAIAAKNQDGETKIFAGCYAARLADPPIQEDFKPLHLIKGKLEPHDGPLKEAVPAKCDPMQ